MSKTVLMAVRVPQYLAVAVKDFAASNNVSVPSFLRYAIDMTLANLLTWSAGDAERVQVLLAVRETQLALNQAKEAELIARTEDATSVLAEMTADVDASVEPDEK